jgi:hypothetical protein
MSPNVLALLAALSFALASTLQQRGTLETAAGEGDPRFLVQILREPVWIVGAALQAAGWILQAAALDRGSLIAVQSICTLSIVFALPLGARLTGQHVGRRSVLGAIATIAGIVGLLALGQPEGGGVAVSTAALIAWLVVVVVSMVVLAGLAGRRRGATAAALFATAAGISFGLQAAATKVFVANLGGGLGAILTMAPTYVLILTAVAGFALQQSALKTGFLAPSMAASNAATLGTSVLLGVVLFGEALANGPAETVVALTSLAVAITGVVILAAPERRLRFWRRGRTASP